MKITRRAARAEVPAMAMGDIAFNLLIFFVILARAQDDSHLQWTPADVKEVEKGRFSRVTVVIDNKRKVYLNGQQVSVTGLADLLKKQLQGVEGKDRVVIFKVHRDAPASIYEPTFEAIGNAGADAFPVFEEH